MKPNSASALNLKLSAPSQTDLAASPSPVTASLWIDRTLNQAAQLGQMGQWQEAIALCTSIVQQVPNNAPAHHFLGLAQLHQGELWAAKEHIEQAIALDPQQPEFYYHAGTIACRLGQLEAGIVAYKQAIAFLPEALEVRYNLAMALQKLNRLEDSRWQYEEILRREPDQIAAHQQLGNGMQKQLQLQEAIAHYRTAIKLLAQPDKVGLAINQMIPARPEVIWYNLGVALQGLQDIEAAMAAYQQALLIDAQYGEAHHALGVCLEQQQHIDEAIAYYQQALHQVPNCIAIWISLGNLQVQQKQWQAGEAAFQHVLQLNPNHLKAIDRLLNVYSSTCQWLLRAEMTAKLWEIGQHQISSDIAIYNTLFLPLSPAQQQVLAQNHATAIAQKVAPLQQQLNFSHSRHSSQPARLRLGYVSGDYREQAIAYLIYRLFELHDRQKFEVFAYSLGTDDGSEYRQKFEQDSDCFRDVSQWTMRAIAQQIYDDGIDILIDLEGYTQYAKPDLYVLKPAPLIVSYLGHPGTMGMNAIDYIITDVITIPLAQTQWLTEQPIYLPEPHIMTNNRQPIAPVPQRSECGLPEDAFVFCVFHKVQKLEPTLFAIWIKILQQVPNSVLWFLQLDSVAIQNLRTAAEKMGVAGDRLIFVTYLPRVEHLAHCHCADLFLDARQHSSSATGVDVLWAGLPLLTLAGDTVAARLCASLLTAVGLPELIASSLEEYERLAVELATQPQQLRAFRQRLIEGRSQSDLFNSSQIVRHLEAGYQMIWEHYQAGHSPQPMIVDPIAQVPIAQVPIAQVPIAQAATSTPRIYPNASPPMSFCFDNILSVQELSTITTKLATAEFVDGKLTARQFAAPQKQNVQLKPDQATAPELKQIVVEAIARNPFFQQAIHPKIIRQPLFNRYDVGMFYGSHVDNAIMGQPPIRSDLSITLFLSDPETYDGGELVLEDHQSKYPVKLSAGSMIVYPSLYLHRVEPVTRGVRLAAVTWIQSFIRDAGDRMVLFDLATAQQSLFDQYGKTQAFDLITKTHANLLRKWADL